MSGILSPSAGHLTAYGKFIMNKNMKVKNTQRIFISEFLSFQISYFPKRLILDKEELILDMEKETLSQRLRYFIS